MAPSEGSTIAKFAIPGILSLIAAVGLLLLGAWLSDGTDRDKSRDSAIERVESKLAVLTTDVAVIKAVVVDSNLAKRVSDLEAEVRIILEKLPR